jgi:uncharacterized protein (DUF488 family)
MAIIYTIGHGRRSSEHFAALLGEAAIKRLVDVRAFPASRRNPHFSKEALASALPSRAIEYQWQGKALGGFRKGGERSVHTALKHPMFRAYAEHMETAAFQHAAQTLAREGEKEPTCIMCAESDPAHCHRSLIADWLVVHGHRVVHILDAGKQRDHTLHPQARFLDSRLIYSGAQPKLF